MIGWVQALANLRMPKEHLHDGKFSERRWEMDYETISAEGLGRSLTGLGLNILVRDVPGQCRFLETVLDIRTHRVSADFAIAAYGSQVFQLHSDGAYHANPLLGLLPENPPRGAGAEIRLYQTDPDKAVERAKEAGYTILQPATNKPHGLREAYILCDDGYAWVPSRPL
jgi:predicted enzyme related to lactoylglutathione lyase